MFLLLAWLASTSRASADRARDAELVRLRGELVQLATRSVWSGVERTYGQMLKLELGLRLEDHVAGAHAALSVGDVTAARQRFRSAGALGEDPDVSRWLSTIDGSYVPVDITGGTLEMLRLNTRPDEVAAVRFAQLTLARDGRFTGLLPYGSYTVDTWTLVLAQPSTFVGP